jgi:hypothetical protein
LVEVISDVRRRIYWPGSGLSKIICDINDYCEAVMREIVTRTFLYKTTNLLSLVYLLVKFGCSVFLHFFVVRVQVGFADYVCLSTPRWRAIRLYIHIYIYEVLIIFVLNVVNKLRSQSWKSLFFRVLLYVGRNQWPCGLRRGSATACLRYCRFESRRGHGCLPLMSVVCCQVEVSASSRPLVHTSLFRCVV